ncbi:type I-B CRISPR-associated protein Cas5b [Anaerocellum danielii]|uniref:Type I-B CRISPR-associated protein Cas5b n=1 Tax=Anaerocellum danielii TaxID=1387557 RepID=A0ABZ0TZV5_9FIRM|nr:type I-B CRISPR-associated protein Cas5b [Caldicellulosiruptor danielii]WPX08950.1 type I-B CRISPR-associated protein Cas5b [Caldicellulosiruptor danielii]
MSFDTLKALKIKIYQPHAQYRMPFAYQRRHTYPLAPYSTVLGFIANVLGIKNIPGQEEPCIKENCSCVYHKFKKIKIAVCGNFQSKTTEYTWLRNLNKKYHVERFGFEQNRFLSGHIEHIGGQSPCFIDVLNDVKLSVYVYHEDEEFLNEIFKRFANPIGKSSTFHLGRAEDLVVINELKKTELKVQEVNGNCKNFFWIPERYFNDKCTVEFEKINALVYKLPTFYKIKEVRIFEYIKVKLNDGILKDISTFFDMEEKIPVFFADFERG